MKYKSYNNLFTNDFFWRNEAQQEIDYVEEYAGTFHAFEFKWNSRKKARFSKSFTNAYENHQLMVVNPENYLEFIQKP